MPLFPGLYRPCRTVRRTARPRSRYIGRAVATGEHADPYPGTRFRRNGGTQTESLGVAAYERGAYRTCIAKAIADGSPDDGEPLSDDLDAVALTAPDRKLPYRVAGEAPGLDAERIAVRSSIELETPGSPDRFSASLMHLQTVRNISLSSDTAAGPGLRRSTSRKTEPCPSTPQSIL